MGLLVMILGLALFFAAHTFTTKREARAQAIARLGEGTYKILYALISLAGLALIIWGYGQYRTDGMIDVWERFVSVNVLRGLKHITVALMLPAVILVIASYLRGRIYATLKHPMLAGIKLWAAAHLLANGDLGSIILFGSILAWAVYDRISLKHRKDVVSIGVAGGGRINDIIVVGVGTILYLALGLVFHPLVIGVPAFSAPA